MGHFAAEMNEHKYQANTKQRRKRAKNLVTMITKIRAQLFSDETIVAQKLKEAEMWLLYNSL